MSEHTVTRRKLNRGPHLTPLFTSVCSTCGPLGPPVDLEDARRAGRRHESSQAQESVAGGVGETSSKCAWKCSHPECEPAEATS